MNFDHRQLRERAERLAAAAAALKQASGADAPFSLAFLTDRRRVPDPEPILEALPAGAAVIYRDYDDPGRERVAARYASICKPRCVLFLVAGDLALAQTIEADGVHWPSRALLPSPALAGEGSGVRARAARDDLRCESANAEGTLTPNPSPVKNGRGELRYTPATASSFIVTASCHDADELRLAHAAGADIAFLGPAFPTQSHPEAEHLGAERFKALAAAAPLPVLALGGVDEENAASLSGRNVAGFGAIGAFAAT